ncbi:MAG: ion transporter [Neomegalonema sp.]|nr:ion transporter [Neomegalonema sp.]
MTQDAALPPAPDNLIRRLVESAVFRWLIIVLIVINAAILGMLTSGRIEAAYGDLLHKIDQVILYIFVAELLARFVGAPRESLRSGWFWFDTIIVSVSFLPSSGDLAVLRTMRVLRILRLLSVSKQMRRVVVGLLTAIPGMMTVVGVLLIVFYAFAVLATKTFGTHPDPTAQQYFGTLGDTFFTLFQVMTLENWADGIARPMMELFPWAWAFFVVFVVVTAFAVLNLFIGIIVDAMQDDRDEAMEEQREGLERFEQERADEILAEIRQLRAEIAALKPPSSLH